MRRVNLPIFDQVKAALALAEMMLWAKIWLLHFIVPSFLPSSSIHKTEARTQHSESIDVIEEETECDDGYWSSGYDRTGISCPPRCRRSTVNGGMSNRFDLELTYSSARSGETMTVRHLSHPNSWTLPVKLFEHYCGRIWRIMYKDTLGIAQSPAAFELFIQWLYERQYNEITDPVKALNMAALLSDNTSLDPPNGTCEMMNWNIKAAILCWELGAHLQAEDFQNHAMTRLFAAFSLPQTAQLTAGVVEYVMVHREHCEKPFRRLLSEFMEDLMVRNWGDERVVDHSNQHTWAKLITYVGLGRKFIQGTILSLEERREVPVDLKDYLIDTEGEA